MNGALLLALLLAAPAPKDPAPAAPAIAGVAAPVPGRKVVDRVAAIVNGQVVTLQELEQHAGPALRQAEALPEGAAREKARTEALQRALDGVVADKLFAEKAKELEIEVTDQ
ncbi:MAG TPA: SurA N-terminal domain-containing protein, partial [Anaeromyxobacteraceae bacterium]|nr:SurA N-terminal domain-containing protein [Anaeromyxobacteraceae bacterium]